MLLELQIQFNKFAGFLFDGYNEILDFLGMEKVGNPFDLAVAGLEAMKVKTKDYKNELGSFGDAVSNAAMKAKESLMGVGEAIGVGTELLTGQSGEGTGGTGGTEEGGTEGGTTSSTGSTGGMLGGMQGLVAATKEFSVSMANDFAGSLADAVVSGESFFKSMSRIFRDILKQIAAMIVKATILAVLFTFLGIGGGTGSGMTKGGSFGQNFMGGLGSIIPGMASGGGVVAGQPYMVGELGPELFMPGQSGTIIPNHNVGGGAIIPDVRISGSDLMLVFKRENQRTRGVNS